jgi:ATP-dependent DNA helicase UvrD/PcrA
MASQFTANGWRAGLDPAALEIATTTATPLRVCAGPGTGKTFSLMRRVWRLLDEGVDPKRIFVVTFTRTAARDLVNSLERLGVEGSSQVRASTLHSYCFSVLQRTAVLEVTGRNPRLLMEFEEEFLKEDLKRPPVRGKRECDRLIKAFEASWARLQSDTPGWPTDPTEREFHRELMDWLRFHQAMLVGELATEMYSYLRSNPASPERTAFDHILVDEFRDLNRANQEIIDLLASTSGITIVGDEDQSIYAGLQYAQPEGIRDFPRMHPGTADAPLDICRRCPKRVVSIANSLISHNGDRDERQLKPNPTNMDGTVEIVQWLTMEDEADGLTRQIQEYLARTKVSLSEVLVLAPRRRIGYLIRSKLRQQGVAAVSYFFEEALEKAKAQERFTLLNLLVHPDDRVSWRSWLGFQHGQRAIRPYARLRKLCTERGLSVPRIMELLCRESVQPSWARHLIERAALLERERAALEPLRDRDLVDALFPEGDPDLGDIRDLASLTLESAPEELNAAQLLDDLRTRIIYPEPPPTDDFVRIMSLHKSKGLSAQLVVIPGCVEGCIPFTLARAVGVEASRNLEEQRRLFYVAITRTSDTLVLSSFLTMDAGMAYSMNVSVANRNGTRARVIASRFLGELGNDAPQPQEGL